MRPATRKSKSDEYDPSGTETVCGGRRRRNGYDLEEDFQRDTALFLDDVMPDESFWCHIPNGGKRPRKTAIRLKKHGVKAGALDNLVIYGGRAYWLELKARYGTLSDSQIECMPKIKSAGSQVGVARTLEDIEFHLKLWGIPLKKTLDEYRLKSQQPVRMSVAEYREVMSRAADKQRKKASWQKKAVSPKPCGLSNPATSKSS